MNQAKEILSADFTAAVGNFALQIRFALQRRFVALFGPSGCGKTSTLKLLTGLLRPLSGKILLQGQPLFDAAVGIDVPPEKRRIGLVFQDARLFPHLSVEENLRFGEEFTPEPERRFSYAEVVQALHLEPLLHRRPASLSGGETQRVALGRTLLASPAVLLMDEPLAAVDLPTRLALLAELKTIQRRFELPILYVSHDLAMVMNLADEVLLMNAGRIAAQGPPGEVLAGFLSSSLLPGETIRNLLEGRVVAHDAASRTSTVQIRNTKLILPHMPVEIGETVRLDLPATEIILAVRRPEGLSARNVLEGKLRRIQHLGERVLVVVDVGFELMVEIVEPTVRGLGLAEGMPVFLVIKATAFRRLE